MPGAWLCAACGERLEGETDRCEHCGEPPLLAGRYRLVEIVGQGATGTTYRAEIDDAIVAVKEMPLGRAGVDTKRFERESRVLQQLEHDRIPAYVDHFTEGKGKRRTLYLVQAFIDGPTLADELVRRRYTEAEVLAILHEICDILTYLHTLQPPVIHRDLKPGNLVRRADGALVLIDFGAVRDVLRDPALGGSTVAGTYGYMAPEQFSGDARPATDLYALGVIAVRLLSRRDPVDLMRGHLLDWRPAVHASEATCALLEDLLQPVALDRPASAAEVQARIDAIMAGPAPDPPAPNPQAATSTALDRVTTDALMPTVLPPMRQRSTAIFLALVGGFFGVHNWYLGRWVRAVASMIFAWTFLPLLISAYDGIKFWLDGQTAFDAEFNPLHVAAERSKMEDVMQRIERLHALKEKGALSAAEFEAQKNVLLGRGDSVFERLSGHFSGQMGQLMGRLESQLDSLPDQLFGRELRRAEKHRKRLERRRKRQAKREERRDERREKRRR